MRPRTTTGDAADVDDEIGPEQIELALARDPRACRLLVAALSPAIHARVTAALARREAVGGGRFSRQEANDLVQEVFVLLWENDGRILRLWDPSRGASLRTFAGLVAERAVASNLRSGRRSAWREDPTFDDDLASLAGGTDALDLRVHDRDFLTRLLDRLREALSPRGLLLFEALYLHERDADEVAREHDMTVESLYVWRSRARKTVQSLAEELNR
jgi:RNA polymerase sigma-70 factor (ECF subfamily)